MSPLWPVELISRLPAMIRGPACHRDVMQQHRPIFHFVSGSSAVKSRFRWFCTPAGRTAERLRPHPFLRGQGWPNFTSEPRQKWGDYRITPDVTPGSCWVVEGSTPY
jgi:hypothetical protein